MPLKIASIGLLPGLLSAGLLASPAHAKNPDRPSGLDTFMYSGCFACHGQQGYGGAGPGFRGDKMLAADDYVIGRILLGGGIMPPFAGTLSDKQVAAVATYIRTSWGNEFGPVAPHQVATSRKALGDNSTAVTPQARGVTP